MKENIRFARKSARAALHGDAAVLARLVLAELRQAIEIDLDVAAHEQIEPAVAIVVGESAAGGPPARGDARLFRDVGERSVVVVVIETVFSKGGDVEILPAVAIDVGGAHTHAPARMSDARLVGDVFEAAFAEVVIERAARSRRVLRGFNGQRVDEVHVRQAVVVVIEQRNAAAHRFDDVLFFRSGVMLECDAGFGGDVAKQDGRRLRGDRRREAGQQRDRADDPAHHRGRSDGAAPRKALIRASVSRNFCWYSSTCFRAFSSSPSRAYARLN